MDWLTDSNATAVQLRTLIQSVAILLNQNLRHSNQLFLK